jgi:hypothetical protein
MRSFLIALILFICNSLTAQQLSKESPYAYKDSTIIKGRIIDDAGKPIETAYILFYPFYLKKYDVTWYEKDTTLSDKHGDFIVNCERHQFFNRRLYFNKKGYFTAAHFFDSIPSYISLDTPIVLHERPRYAFTTRKINENFLGMTVARALNLLKLDISQSYLIEIRNSENVHAKALRMEAADSSMILLIVEEYSDPSKSKLNVLSMKVVGVGIAFTNGEKRFFGDAILYQRKVYNEHYLSKED